MTEIQALHDHALNISVPRWFTLFSDPTGGFHERLDASGQPLDMPKRLVTQCRQIMVYSMAGDPAYTAKLNEAFQFIQANFFNPETGGSIFSQADRKYDLYALAFVLSACAAYYTATRNSAALNYAHTTIDFITARFGMDTGLAESIPVPDTNIRRQNPHMHLLEGAMAMMDVSDHPVWRAYADDMINLFFSHFFDGKNLYEFFDMSLGNPQPAIEAGHHAEWVWLLHRYQSLTGADNRITAAQTVLFDWVKAHGLDNQNGGAWNAQQADGTITNSGKRIWPQMETLRAAIIMKDTAMTQNLIDLLQKHYLYENGLWLEERDKEMGIVADYLPGTTPYHIFPVLQACVSLSGKA